MKKMITFTNTISPQLMYWLTNYAKNNNMTKKAVIESALIFYKEHQIKQEMKNGFKRASTDVEIKKISDEGLEDFIEINKKFDI